MATISPDTVEVAPFDQLGLQGPPDLSSCHGRHGHCAHLTMLDIWRITLADPASSGKGWVHLG